MLGRPAHVVNFDLQHSTAHDKYRATRRHVLEYADSIPWRWLATRLPCNSAGLQARSMYHTRLCYLSLLKPSYLVSIAISIATVIAISIASGIALNKQNRAK